MLRPRTIALALAALAACLALLAPSGHAQDAQAVFRTAILEDGRTTSAIKKLLRSGGGFVDPGVVFGDLTGDGKADAVVRVSTGGAAGTVAVYVLSTQGSSRSTLRPIYRNQGLYRATAKVLGSTLVLTVPRYARGDEPCCASAYVERTYQYRASKKAFVRIQSRTLTPELAGGSPPVEPDAGAS